MGSCKEPVKENTPGSDTTEHSEVTGDYTKDCRSNNSIVFILLHQDADTDHNSGGLGGHGEQEQQEAQGGAARQVLL